MKQLSPKPTKVKLSLLGLIGLFYSCSNSQQARQPILSKPLTNLHTKEQEELIKINKQLIAKEEAYIDQLTSKRSENFKQSSAGFWYAAHKKNCKLACKSLGFGDTILLSYQVKDLSGRIIYEEGEHPYLYLFGKTFYFQSFEQGLELMHEGDEYVFIFPWYLAYGSLGDGNNIPGNTSIEYRVKLNRVKKNKTQL